MLAEFKMEGYFRFRNCGYYTINLSDTNREVVSESNNLLVQACTVTWTINEANITSQEVLPTLSRRFFQTGLGIIRCDAAISPVDPHGNFLLQACIYLIETDASELKPKEKKRALRVSIASFEEKGVLIPGSLIPDEIPSQKILRGANKKLSHLAMKTMKRFIFKYHIQGDTKFLEAVSARSFVETLTTQTFEQFQSPKPKRQNVSELFDMQ